MGLPIFRRNRNASYNLELPFRRGIPFLKGIGLVPKFAGCVNGANWFKSNGKWQDRTYEPKAGDIIFFDWESDGTTDHVGIVEKCENGTVYTVEGNSGDACRTRINKLVNEGAINNLQSDEYVVEEVRAVYLSKEYLDEVAYNSQSNLYFGTQ